MKMAAKRTGIVVAAWLLAGCGPEKAAETEDATTTTTTGSSGGMSGSTGGSSGAPTTSGSTGTGSASEGPGSTSGSSPPCAGDQSSGPPTCAAFDNRATCNAAPLDPAIGECIWVAWVPVRLVDDMCTFGEPRGVCQFVGCSNDGCPSLETCGTPGLGGGFMVGMNDQVSVAAAPWCEGPEPPAMPCEVDAQGEVLAGAPECACLCDPGFPGSL